MTTLFGFLVYLIAIALGAMMWRRGGAGEASFESLLEKSEQDHHRVLRITAKHPHGGRWGDYRAWEREESTALE